MPNLDSLEKLMQDELKDIYDAEKRLTKTLPKLAKKVSAAELKDETRSPRMAPSARGRPCSARATSRRSSRARSKRRRQPIGS